MALKIVVVGAGIGGLCAAVALHQAGHEVTVLEKSRFIGEVGAALLVTPNGSCVLQNLGFSFDNARGDRMTSWEVLDGVTLDTLAKTELSDAETRYGAPLYTMHRSDLHNELVRISKTASQGQRHVDLRVASKVVSVSSHDGSVELEDGTRLSADLVIGADGVHSVARSAIIDGEIVATPSGMSAFRFQIATAKLKDDEHFKQLLTVKGKGSTVLADTNELSSERHLVWYDCQNGQIQNFVGIHSACDTKATDLKQVMLREFEHFHPSVVHIINLATEVGDWPLTIYEPFPQWHRGRVVLMGDAAHPMLPFGGQGANQAIEDAGALGSLLRDVRDPSEIPGRLQLYETVRRLRASRIQTLSRVRLGKEKDVAELVKKYADSADTEVPSSFKQRYEHDFGFNVLEKCREIMQQQPK